MLQNIRDNICKLALMARFFSEKEKEIVCFLRPSTESQIPWEYTVKCGLMKSFEVTDEGKISELKVDSYVLKFLYINFCLCFNEHIRELRPFLCILEDKNYHKSYIAR